jgi:hypothetical protein
MQNVDVVDGRVVNIDVVDKNVAGMEAGIIRLMEAEREPAHAESSTESKSDTPVLPSQEANKRGTVERTLVDRTRAPTPPAADV